MLYLVSDIIADSFYLDFSMEIFNNLPIYCADSKLKRLPALFIFINID